MSGQVENHPAPGFHAQGFVPGVNLQARSLGPLAQTCLPKAHLTGGVLSKVFPHLLHPVRKGN